MFCKSATSVIEMFLREATFLVQNCSFHEMIISDNPERGRLKLQQHTAHAEKKANATENIISDV